MMRRREGVKVQEEGRGGGRNVVSEVPGRAQLGSVRVGAPAQRSSLREPWGDSSVVNEESSNVPSLQRRNTLLVQEVVRLRGLLDRAAQLRRVAFRLETPNTNICPQPPSFNETELTPVTLAAGASKELVDAAVQTDDREEHAPAAKTTVECSTQTSKSLVSSQSISSSSSSSLQEGILLQKPPTMGLSSSAVSPSRRSAAVIHESSPSLSSPSSVESEKFDSYGKRSLLKIVKAVDRTARGRNLLLQLQRPESRSCSPVSPHTPWDRDQDRSPLTSSIDGAGDENDNVCGLNDQDEAPANIFSPYPLRREEPLKAAARVSLQRPLGPYDSPQARARGRLDSVPQSASSAVTSVSSLTDDSALSVEDFSACTSPAAQPVKRSQLQKQGKADSLQNL